MPFRWFGSVSLLGDVDQNRAFTCLDDWFSSVCFPIIFEDSLSIDKTCVCPLLTERLVGPSRE